MRCGWSLGSTHPFWQSPVDVLILSIAAVLSSPASYCYQDYTTQPTNERKDTSMTATMLLQDSMLKPSVFRSASKIQERSHSPGCLSLLHKCVQILEGWISTDHKDLPALHTETWEMNSNYDTHTNMSYALQWFCLGCSAAQMGSLPCPTWQIVNSVNIEPAETCTDTQLHGVRRKTLLEE